MARASLQHSPSSSSTRSPARRSRALLPMLAGSVLLAFLLSLGVGSYPLGWSDVAVLIGAALDGSAHGVDPAAAQVFWQLRLPRAASALLVGAGLAASGTVLQRVFRNPLAAPELLGVSAGSALGAALAIIVGASALMLHLSAFAGGILAIALVLALGPLMPSRDRLLGLILTGVTISSVTGALLAALIAFADPRSSLPAIAYWMLGSFASTSLASMVWLALTLALALAPMFALRWRVDLLALGDDEARAMGVDSHRLRLVLLALAALATSASVAVVGVIGWVGLVVPHLARRMTGGAFADWLPASALMGALFMLLIDTGCRLIGPVELPPGVLAALLGAPLLFVLMRRGPR